MDVALDGSQENLSCLAGLSAFSRIDVGLQDTDGLLHGARGLHHLRQEHLSLAEELAHAVHACHQRPLNDVDGSRILGQCFLQVGLQVVADAFDEGVREALSNWTLPRQTLPQPLPV